MCIAPGAFLFFELDAANETGSEQRRDCNCLRKQAKSCIAYGKQWPARIIMAEFGAGFGTAQVSCLLAVAAALIVNRSWNES